MHIAFVLSELQQRHSCRPVVVGIVLASFFCSGFLIRCVAHQEPQTTILVVFYTLASRSSSILNQSKIVVRS
jgi:hypothetical protein